MTEAPDQQLDPVSGVMPLQDAGESCLDIIQLISDQQAGIRQFHAELKDLVKSEALNTARQLEAFHQLHGLVGDLPDSLHGWPISPDFALKLVRLVRDNGYDLIVEFGSGISTYLELQALESLRPHVLPIPGVPGLIVFEHLERCLRSTRELIAANPFSTLVDLVLRPLQPWQDESGSYLFYSGTEIIAKAVRARLSRTRLHGKPIESSQPLKLLVVIDGPPGDTCRWARYPALPIILSACAGMRVAIDVLLDDVMRFDEKEMAEAWEAKLRDLNIAYVRQDLPYEKGGLLLRVPSLSGTAACHEEVAEASSALDVDEERLMRRLTGLERECERRYAALRLSQEQAVIIRQLLAEKEASRLLEIDLRAQLTDRIQAIHELEQALRLLHPHLDEPAAAVAESIVIPPEVDPELEQLREKNLLLQLQLKQVQEELEHYVLLAQGQRCLASPAAVDVPHPLSEPLATREQVSDTINRNRARLQLSTREP